jgi:hypothetical protein
MTLGKREHEVIAVEGAHGRRLSGSDEALATSADLPNLREG